jgi:sterol desaturase/sphingolipid hydroxylase (fatty acid hydroxylase superfamily)/protein-tyrosine-phosphatase
MDTGTLVLRLLPIFAALALATLIETLVPLRNQQRRLHGRLSTNLWLVGITLALGMLLNFLLVVGAAYVGQSGAGLLQRFGAGPIASFIVAIVALDGASYLVHRVLHRVPTLWRVHLVHHIDAAVDATTAFRQHPIEGVLRFAFVAAPAWILGAPPAAVALYRLLGALNSVLEHSNIRVPRWLDRLLVSVWVTPHMHKVHHSRERAETDSNYANLFSFFDRLFGTYTPSSRGAAVSYGIEGYDDPRHQSLGAVLALPFRRVTRLPGRVWISSIFGLAIALGTAQRPDAAEPSPVRQVTFVCEHGSAKSLMAASYFNQLAQQRGLPVRGVSRGSAPDSDAAPTSIARELEREGFDVSGFRPSAVSARDVQASERVITIGTTLPTSAESPPAKLERWDDIPAASTNYAASSAALKARVEELIESLAESPTSK